MISKANYGILNPSKKWTNKFVLTSMRLVFVCFLQEIEDSKKTFAPSKWQEVNKHRKFDDDFHIRNQLEFTCRIWDDSPISFKTMIFSLQSFWNWSAKPIPRNFCWVLLMQPEKNRYQTYLGIKYKVQKDNDYFLEKIVRILTQFQNWYMDFYTCKKNSKRNKGLIKCC